MALRASYWVATGRLGSEEEAVGAVTVVGGEAFGLTAGTWWSFLQRQRLFPGPAYPLSVPPLPSFYFCSSGLG